MKRRTCIRALFTAECQLVMVRSGPAIFGSGQSHIRRAETVEVNQLQQVAAPEAGSQEIGRLDDEKRSDLLFTADDIGRFRVRIMAPTGQTD
jgi:hypothetical protein